MLGWYFGSRRDDPFLLSHAHTLLVLLANAVICTRTSHTTVSDNSVRCIAGLGSMCAAIIPFDIPLGVLSHAFSPKNSLAQVEYQLSVILQR
uniref:Uncharacterized protein n=1 Tax=Arundo donax TaxID=35708 RepID=A0A0A9FB67_ARUDO